MTDPDSDLRPLDWEDFIGQERLKAELQVQIDAAVKERRNLRHLLLAATPGAGKTTLAALIADRLNDQFRRVVMPLQPKALARLLQRCTGVLLLDELHRSKPMEQEVLLTVIEDGYFQQDNGRRVEVKGLTIIGATTEPMKIIRPLWDRFEAQGGVPTFDDYTDEELAQIVLGMACQRGVDISDGTALAYGRAAAGTPRLAAKFVNRHSELAITLCRSPTAEETLKHLRMTMDGLTANHVKYLEILDALGGTKGVEMIAKLLRLPRSLVEDLEILLVTRDYIEFTPGGREITGKGSKLVRRPPERGRLNAA